MRRYAYSLFALLLIVSPSFTKEEAKRPNFLIIVADDLGLECVQAYGGLSYKTPNIDALAKNGVRFTHAFANPSCSPTRAMLLTGKYPLHNGIKQVIFSPKHFKMFLDPKKHTGFAKRLQGEGYATAMAGKWQVSFLHEHDNINDFGFDEYQAWQIWVDGKKSSRFARPTMRQNGQVLGPDKLDDYGPNANLAFLTDFMERKKDESFCIYYTCLLPHYPWEPTPDSGVPLKAADGKGDPKRYMPDMVEYLDKQVGQLVAKLDELGLRENTIVIFTSDNGTDQLVTTRWTDGKVNRDVKGGKGTMTDAGTRVPLIVNWPARIKPGRVADDLVDLSDMLPTVLDLAGADSQPGINGRSFAARLRDEPYSSREWVHVRNQSKRYVRNQHYILDNQGALRSVVETGQKKAQPLAALNEKQRAARDTLEAALGETSSPLTLPGHDRVPTAPAP